MKQTFDLNCNSVILLGPIQRACLNEQNHGALQSIAPLLTIDDLLIAVFNYITS